MLNKGIPFGTVRASLKLSHEEADENYYLCPKLNFPRKRGFGQTNLLLQIILMRFIVGQIRVGGRLRRLCRHTHISMSGGGRHNSRKVQGMCGRTKGAFWTDAADFAEPD